MRRTRMAAAAVTLALLGASASTGVAGAATPDGVGTSKNTTTALDLSLGNLLGLRVLGDDAQASLDNKVVPQPEAFSRLVPLDITGALGHITPIPALEARSTGAEKKATLPTTAIPVSSVPSLLATGAFDNGLLSALVDKDGAHSGLNIALNNLKLANGALLDTGLVSNLGANALHPNSNNVRGVNVPTLKLLDLGFLLKGLGIDILKMPLDKVTGLLTSLNLKVPDVTNPGKTLSGAGVKDLVGTLQGVLNGTGSLPGTTLVKDLPTTPDPTNGLPNGLLDTVTGLLPNLPVDTTPVTSVVTTVTDLLNSLLNSVLTTLDGTSLLNLGGIQLGTSTKASSTAADSSADTTGKIGSVSVGGVTLPATDVLGVVNSVNDTLGNVLGGLGLGNILQLQTLAQNKSVGSSGGYINSVAGLTGLVAKLNPLGALSSVVSGLNVGGTGSIGGILGAANPAAASTLKAQQVSTPGMPAQAAAAGLGNLLGGVTSVLTNGLQLKIGDLQTQSNFIPAAVAPPAQPVPGTLAFTGANTGILALFGILLIALGAGGFGWLRKSGSVA